MSAASRVSRRSLIAGSAFLVLGLISGCAEQTVTSQKIDRYMLFFDHHYDVVKEGDAVLAKAVEASKENPEDVFVISGFADETEAAGIDLRRANAVADRLVEMGVPRERLVTVSGGTDAQVQVGDTVIREASYRVEIFIK